MQDVYSVINQALSFLTRLYTEGPDAAAVRVQGGAFPRATLRRERRHDRGGNGERPARRPQRQATEPAAAAGALLRG